MDWTLADIRTKVRSLTGRPSTGQLATADLDNQINNFYRNVLPSEAELKSLQTWYTLATTASDDGNYGLTAAILSVRAPVTLEDSDGNVSKITLFTDRTDFFDIYPPDQETEDDRATPTGVLAYDRALYLRPLPDAVYTLKFAALRRPSALSEATDSPLDYQFGPIIAYGAAIEILKDGGEHDEADALVKMYLYHRGQVAVRQIQQQPLGQRATPRF